MPDRSSISTISKTLLIAAGCVTLLGGCPKRLDVQGWIPDESVIAEVRPHVDNKDSIQQLLGTPSAVGTFDDNTWYYINKRVETFAFFAPQTTAELVLAVHFDKNGSLDPMKRYGLADARSVPLESKITPTRGKELGFLEQLFGNLGRFSGAGGDTQGGSGGAGGP